MVNIILLLHAVISQGDFTGAGEDFIGSKEINVVTLSTLVLW